MYRSIITQALEYIVQAVGCRVLVKYRVLRLFLGFAFFVKKK